MGSCTNHFNPSSSGSAGPSSFSPTSSLEPEPLLCLPRLTPPWPRGLLRSPSRCVPRGMLAGPFPGGGSLWLVPGPLATSPSGQELGCGQLRVPHKAFAEDLLCARPGDSTAGTHTQPGLSQAPGPSSRCLLLPHVPLGGSGLRQPSRSPTQFLKFISTTLLSQVTAPSLSTHFLGPKALGSSLTPPALSLVSLSLSLYLPHHHHEHHHLFHL